MTRDEEVEELAGQLLAEHPSLSREEARKVVRALLDAVDCLQVPDSAKSPR